MKIVKHFEECGEAVHAYVEEFQSGFLEANKELVAKTGEPVARAILSTQIGAHMSAQTPHDVSALIMDAQGGDKNVATAIHDLRIKAAGASAGFATGFIKMFGVLASEHVATIDSK